MNNTAGFPLNTYFDTRFARQAVKILPGQYFVTGEDKLIVTVLGSCVAACMYDPQTGVGGMNHFLLPSNIYVSIKPAEVNKYGEQAMSTLESCLIASGAAPERLVAKIFGGGQVLPGFSSQDVGSLNVSFVKHYLDARNIPVLSEDLLSNYARKVYFFPATGDVFMKRIRDLNNDTVMERESEHRYQLNQYLAPHDEK